MRRLLPEPSVGVDPFLAYDDQPATWLRIGMVASIDGSATDERGRSSGLGGAPDQRVFRTLRGLADAILVGAGTAAIEGYGPDDPPAAVRERRLTAGRAPAAPLAVVTRSLQLDWSAPLFTAASSPTVVVTCAAAAHTQPVPASVPLVVAGAAEVDLGTAVRRLRDEHGLRQLLCEGGPTLATALLTRGLADELCLTLAPELVGAGHHTALIGGLDQPVDLTLAALYEDRGVLLARYRPA